MRQKSLASRGALALIRCDGGGRFGFGHIKRMVTLARALRDREGIGCIFAVNGTADALAPIHQAGFESTRVPSASAADTLMSIVGLHAPDLLIADVREGLSVAEMAILSGKVTLSAVIDDASDRRKAADFAYLAPLPQTERLDWTDSQCVPRIGWEWSLLGLTRIAPSRRGVSPRPTLLVAMGGSDPAGLTLTAARALAKLEPVFRARFVIGPGFRDRSHVANTIVSLASHFETLEGADDLATEYAASDLALASFGTTAYELAAHGVPAVYLCLTPDHAMSASAFERAGMGISLGVAAQLEGDDLARAVWTLLTDSARRREMRAAGLMTIDGEGARRIAADLAMSLAARRAPAARIAAQS